VRVHVLYFATLKQRVGSRNEELELPEGATVADLKAAVAAKHPDVVPSLPTVITSVNREFARADHPLAAGDEVGLFPPVSGGGEPPTVLRVSEDELDFNSLLASIGAACVFSGMVRGRTERNGGRETERLEYEAYPGMAEEKMRQVADEIRARWPHVEGIAIVQRVGNLARGTPTVLIACSAAHRDSGVFEAARYGIDRLKEIVPIWKKEVGPDGETWIEGHYTPGEDDRRP
jgi:molybdopterin converting factor subunit 1